MKTPETYNQWKHSPKGRIFFMKLKIKEILSIPKQIGHAITVISDITVLLIINKRFRTLVEQIINEELTTKEKLQFQLVLYIGMILLCILIGWSEWRYITQ